MDFVAVLFDWHTGSVNWSYMFALNGIRLCTLDVSIPMLFACSMKCRGGRSKSRYNREGDRYSYRLICVFLCRTSRILFDARDIEIYRGAHKLIGGAR